MLFEKKNIYNIELTEEEISYLATALEHEISKLGEAGPYFNCLQQLFRLIKNRHEDDF